MYTYSISSSQCTPSIPSWACDSGVVKPIVTTLKYRSVRAVSSVPLTECHLIRSSPTGTPMPRALAVTVSEQSSQLSRERSPLIAFRVQVQHSLWTVGAHDSHFGRRQSLIIAQRAMGSTALYLGSLSLLSPLTESLDPRVGFIHFPSFTSRSLNDTSSTLLDAPRLLLDALRL